MVAASLFHAILVYKGFYRNALLSDSGGNLYVVKHNSVSVRVFLNEINIQISRL